MPKIKIPTNALIVVCDARKALVFANAGDEELPDLRIVETIDAEPNPATAEQGTDRPGRLADAGGQHRSAVEQTDWHARSEAAFAGEIADRLEERRRSGNLERLILVAPPKMLGDLRNHLPPQLSEKIVEEIDKDFVNLPTDQIEKALTGG